MSSPVEIKSRTQVWLISGRLWFESKIKPAENADELTHLDDSKFETRGRRGQRSLGL
jgi:hypothetical protein